MQSNKKVYFDSLESLRGIAALLVVFYHMYWLSPIYSVGLIRNGALMVDLFFVLSGFVIFYVYENKLRSWQAIGRFVWLRFWRVYPLHLAMLLLFVFIELAEYVYMSRFGGSLSEDPFLRNNWSSFLNHIFLIHSMGFQSSGSFNAPSWSISVEFFTYILFSIVTLCFQGTKTRFCLYISFAIISLIIILVTGHYSLTFDYNWSFFRCTYGFFIGAATAWYFTNQHTLGNSNPVKDNYVVALSVLVLLALIIVKHDSFLEFLVPVAVAFLIFELVSRPKSIISKFLELAPFRWLGKISYSIYMTHMLILWFLSSVLQVVFNYSKTEISSGDILFNTTEGEGIALSFLAIALVLAASTITFHFIEKPFRNYGKRRTLDSQFNRQES